MTIGHDYTSTEILDALTRHNEIRISLRSNDRAWNPASTSSTIAGPATVRYIQHRDGGIDVTVRDEKWNPPGE